jgi:hypothetical protein
MTGQIFVFHWSVKLCLMATAWRSGGIYITVAWFNTKVDPFTAVDDCSEAAIAPSKC